MASITLDIDEEEQEDESAPVMLKELPSPSRVSNAKLIEVPTINQVNREEVNRRKKLIDLPSSPSQMNVISIIIAYTLFGLTDYDIADAINLKLEQIQRIRMLDEYTIMRKAIIENLVKNDAEDVRTMFVNESKNAVKKVARLMDCPDPAISLAASKDILDRAGHRPADIIEHKHSMEGSLTIEYIKKDKETIPSINLGNIIDM